MTEQEEPLRNPRDAFRLANDLVMDLVAGCSTYNVLRTLSSGWEGVPEYVQTAAARLCVFHTIISLSKWTELYDRYKGVIPPAVQEDAKRLRAEVETRGIIAFRNKVVGHVWDPERHRALSNAEVDQRLEAIQQPDVAAFLNWAGNPDARSDGESAVVVIERVRDSIRQHYHFTDADLNR